MIRVGRIANAMRIGSFWNAVTGLDELAVT